MGPEGLNNAPAPKKGVKETLQKLARLAAFGAALTGAPAETKSMQVEKLPMSENIDDRRTVIEKTATEEELEYIVLNPNFDMQRMTALDPALKEVMVPSKNIAPLNSNMKPPSAKKAPETKAAPKGNKPPAPLGW